MKCRSVVWPHCHSQVGNGEKTSVWYDMWHPLSHLCAFISSREINRVGLSADIKVKDVVGNEGWAWPEEWQDKFPGLFEFEPPKLMDGKVDKQRTWAVWRELALNLLSCSYVISSYYDSKGCKQVLCGLLVGYSRGQLGRAGFSCNYVDANVSISKAGFIVDTTFIENILLMIYYEDADEVCLGIKSRCRLTRSLWVVSPEISGPVDVKVMPVVICCVFLYMGCRGYYGCCAYVEAYGKWHIRPAEGVLAADVIKKLQWIWFWGTAATWKFEYWVCNEEYTKYSNKR
ncbi:hypothetical protein SSX86_032121 [Deinandra increscens subsp. villosa]|uniref:Uncharacterized protein n=1 Tax=Deinandra increscens subsp. villosa TaxID=3103831 RepID=A0AAP0GI23_9ASTR